MSVDVLYKGTKADGKDVVRLQVGRSFRVRVCTMSQDVACAEGCAFESRVVGAAASAVPMGQCETGPVPAPAGRHRHRHRHRRS